MEIGQPVGIQMESDVLKPEVVLGPSCHFFNEEGTYVMVVRDCDLAPPGAR